MSILQEVEKLLIGMTRAEKAQLLQWVVRDLGDAYSCVESQSQVCGGVPCIVRTRIPVWVLEQAKRLGTNEADLLRCYPACGLKISRTLGPMYAHIWKKLSNRFRKMKRHSPWLVLKKVSGTFKE